MTPEEQTAIEPCRIHLAIEAQKRAVLAWARRSRKRGTMPKDVILGIYHDDKRPDMAAEYWGVSVTFVRRVKNGTIYSEVTGCVA